MKESQELQEKEKQNKKTDEEEDNEMLNESEEEEETNEELTPGILKVLYFLSIRTISKKERKTL